MKKSAMAIGMAFFCFMMMAAGAAWCELKVPIPPNGTVLDTSTGLVWTQNANCFGRLDSNTAWRYTAKLQHGDCGLTDGSKAGDWRVPTHKEMSKRQGNKQGFYGVQAYYYWTSTIIDIPSGRMYMVIEVGGPEGAARFADHDYNVWPVRNAK